VTALFIVAVLEVSRLWALQGHSPKFLEQVSSCNLRRGTLGAKNEDGAAGIEKVGNEEGIFPSPAN